MKKRILTLAALATCAALVACTTVQTTGAGTVGVNRQQTMSLLVSSAQLEAQAASYYTDVVRKGRADGSLNADPAMTRRVRDIFERLRPHTAVFNPAAAGWNWEVNVLARNDLNAWCAPGGKIMFYSGIINRLRLTDDEIAAVMGHEIAHALREHGRERASQQMNAQLGLQILQLATRNQQLTSQAADMAKLLYVLPNSRTHETEADRMGIELMARAGYNPRGAVTVWEKMAAANRSSGPEFLSTHPSPPTRMADLTQYEQIVRPLYLAAQRQGGPGQIVPVAAPMAAVPTGAPPAATVPQAGVVPAGGSGGTGAGAAAGAGAAVAPAAAASATRPPIGYQPQIPNPSMFRRN